jgi:hypothetical protein
VNAAPVAPASAADGPDTASDQLEKRTATVPVAGWPATLAEALIVAWPAALAVTLTEQLPLASVRQVLPPTKVAPPEAVNCTSTSCAGAPPDVATAVTVVAVPVSES